MQRIVIFPCENLSEQELLHFSNFDSYQRLISLDSKIFAIPKVREHVVEWYTQFEGQPVLSTWQNLSAQQQQKLTEKTQAVANLATKLAEDDTSPPQLIVGLKTLGNALNKTNTQIYLINNVPVLVNWSGDDKKSATPVPVVATTGLGLWRWLLPLLLCLLLLLVLGWYFFFNKVPNAVIDSVITPKPEIAKVKPIQELPQEKPQEKPKEPVVIPEEVKPANIPEIVQIEPPEPVIESTPKIVEVKPSKPMKVCKKRVKKNINYPMYLIFDNSASMKNTLLEKLAVVDDYMYRRRLGYVSFSEVQRMSRKPNRISIAKSTIQQIIDTIPKNVDISLITFNGNYARSNGTYVAAKRAQLKRTILNLGTDNNTPMYGALSLAFKGIKNNPNDGLILLITDAQGDNDGLDAPVKQICALGKEFAKQHQNIKIGLVNIGGGTAFNCLATASKGQFYSANNVKQLKHAIKSAVTPILIEDCKK